jgi:hypothetical protein
MRGMAVAGVVEHGWIEWTRLRGGVGGKWREELTAETTTMASNLPGHCP